MDKIEKKKRNRFLYVPAPDESNKQEGVFSSDIYFTAEERFAIRKEAECNIIISEVLKQKEKADQEKFDEIENEKMNREWLRIDLSPSEEDNIMRQLGAGGFD